VASLRAHRFNLYVDGALSDFVGTSCSEIPVGAAYNCSGRLPPMSAGKHTLALSSVLNGVESERSSVLVVTMRSATVTAVVGASSASTPTGTASPQAATMCTPSSGACYLVSGVVDDVGPPSALTRASDGLLMFVEDHARVRVIERGILLPDAALSSDSPSRIVGMTADTDFDRTRYVFIATSEPAGDGMASLTITRYREVNGGLGEGAPIVSGLITTAMAIVPLAVDGNGLLYVALPADPATARGDSPLGGAILRFDRDGMTPRSNPRPVPAIAHGYTKPTTLAVDEATKRLWLGGRSSTGPSLATLALDRMGAAWPLQPALIDATALSVTRSSQVVAGPAIALATAGASSSAMVTADASLVVGALPPDGRSASLEVLPVGDVPVSVMRDSGEVWYVAVLSDQGLGRILMLQRLATGRLGRP
jgi:glucose/arabinose dehydrogenase